MRAITQRLAIHNHARHRTVFDLKSGQVIEYIEVKDSRQNHAVIDTIWRTPRNKAAIKMVRYDRRWYRLFGGVNSFPYIDISNPIKDRP